MLPIKNVDAPLHVVCCISNPARYRSRYHLFRQFEKYIEDSGAILHVIELAFGDRPFEITSSHNPHHHQVRTNHEVWHKENLLNIAISRLPNDWKYVATIDADVTFTRPDWVEETIHQLQHYSVVQMFSHALDLGPKMEPLKTFDGFVASWMRHPNGNDKGPYGTWHPGYAWAWRRDAIDALGGLIDWAIVGSADRHMACALIGHVDWSFYKDLRTNCPVYTQFCLEWQERAEKYVKRNVGYVDGLLLHYWHGPKSARGYCNRWRIIVDNHFDPNYDLKKDWQGVFMLTDRSLDLRDSLRRYFRSRDEDAKS